MDINSFIKPELLALIPVLNLIGVWVKTTRIPNRFIPAALGAAGVAVGVIWTLAGSDMENLKNVAQGVVTGVVQGLLCAAGAVYGNQVYKQARAEDRGEKQEDRGERTEDGNEG